MYFVGHENTLVARMTLFGGFTPRAQAVEDVNTSIVFEDENLLSFSFRELFNRDKIGCERFFSVLHRNYQKMEKKYL